MRYQPHPAFARGPDGAPRYRDLSPADLEGIASPADFAHQGSRTLRASDYVHQIKRLASPEVNSPILGVMSEHIVGLADLAERLRAARDTLAPGEHLDLTRHDFEGARAVDDRHFEIRVNGVYPQLRYWLAMPFFAPMPPEAIAFYNQDALAAKNIGIDTFPVGTGPYMLTENNPNRRMVLETNPNFHGERYPSEGAPGDREAGLLEDAGRALPFIDRVVFSLEKESIPYWNKFLQGYYDSSGISSDAFGQAIRIDADGEPHLTETMAERGVRLYHRTAGDLYLQLRHERRRGRRRRRRRSQAAPGDLDRRRLRVYVAIFLNSRGLVAQDPPAPEACSAPARAKPA